MKQKTIKMTFIIMINHIPFKDKITFYFTVKFYMNNARIRVVLESFSVYRVCKALALNLMR